MFLELEDTIELISRVQVLILVLVMVNDKY